MSAPSVATEGHVPDTTTSTTSPTTSTAPEAAHRRRHVQLNEGQTARYGVPVPLVAGVERPVGPKLKGWDFYRAIGSPKFIAAPMVDQSEYVGFRSEGGKRPDDLVLKTESCNLTNCHHSLSLPGLENS